MIVLGTYNSLEILRNTSAGLFLGEKDGAEVLLPNKYLPKSYVIGDAIRVFCYLDHQERPVATTMEPMVTRNHFAFLKVEDVSTFGAFLDWGLEKHLFVPFREQAEKMEKDRYYLVYCYLDEESFRLAASSRLERFFNNTDTELAKGQKVDLIAYRKTNLGWEVIINHLHKGLIFFGDIFREIEVGDQFEGYVKNIRADGKIDIILQPEGFSALVPTAEKVYQKLKTSDGYLPLHDKSDPQAIYETFQISKKAYKKAIGLLYKTKKIDLKQDGIYIK